MRLRAPRLRGALNAPLRGPARHGRAAQRQLGPGPSPLSTDVSLPPVCNPLATRWPFAPVRWADLAKEIRFARPRPALCLEPVVRAAAQLQVGRAGRAAIGKRNHVVILEESSLGTSVPRRHASLQPRCSDPVIHAVAVSAAGQSPRASCVGALRGARSAPGQRWPRRLRSERDDAEDPAPAACALTPATTGPAPRAADRPCRVRRRRSSSIQPSPR